MRELRAIWMHFPHEYVFGGIVRQKLMPRAQASGES